MTIARPPQRVLTQGPEPEVFVAAAGAADRIVGRQHDPTAPLGRYEEALRNVPTIGTGNDEVELSREQVVARNPDFVVNRGPGNDLPADALSAVGIQSYVVTGRCTDNQSGIVANGSFDQIYSEVETFGRIFGTEETTKKAVTDLRQRVAAVQAQPKSLPDGSTAAAVAVEGRAVYGYGNKATLQSQLEALGLRNVFSDQGARYFEASLEEYINRDPDVLIVLNYEGSLDQQAVTSLPELASLRAVREGRVLSVPFGLTAASPLAVDGLESLAEQLRHLSG